MAWTFPAVSRRACGSRTRTRCGRSCAPSGSPRPWPDVADDADPPRRRQVWSLRRPVCPRDADERAPGARGHVARGQGRPEFQLELAGHRRAFIGRPTPLYAATRLSEHFGGTHIHFKREDLCHTGAHKLNNAVGQALLALRMGKKRVIAETGAGQHGVATATVCARFGFECTVYMGTEDMRRQSMNVRRMKLLGAEVVEVTAGTKTLKDATSEAIRDWVTNVRTTHYIIGSVVGPHPYPEMVRDLQRVIGDEAREQYLSVDGKLPDVVIACVGGGSNAISMFTAFLDDKDDAPVGVQAAGLA